MNVHCKITVYGYVQGVGFRYNALRVAGHLGLNGFIRNEPDGTVYIEVEGPPEKIDEYIQWCQRGPVHAEVTGVRHEFGSLQGFAGFSIR